MMNRRYDQDFDPEYYRLFYDSIKQVRPTRGFFLKCRSSRVSDVKKYCTDKGPPFLLSSGFANRRHHDWTFDSRQQ